MIKTLRITSIVAAILAAVFFILSVVFGVRSDEQAVQFLNSASVIEKFSKARGDREKRSESQISPLVKQAEAFALYLNPPAPKMPAAAHKPSIVHRPPTVTPKFELVGTSVYGTKPELSLALINEPGKGFRWVRQSSEVGHLIIEQVKDGLVVVRDGKRTFELPVAERPERRSLLKGKGPSSGETGSTVRRPVDKSSPALGSRKAGSLVGAVASPPSAWRASTTSRQPAQMSDEESALMEKLMGKVLSEMEAVEVRAESGEIDLEHSTKKSDELIEKFMSDLESIRISSEEAKRLGRLGRELEDVQRDPNRAKSRKVERPKSSEEPNEPSRTN